MFLARLAHWSLAAVGVVLGSLFAGALGYHLTEGQSWLDATLSAAMILTGMGPVTPVVTPAGKVFAIVYALYSGVVFLVVSSMLLGPILHRVLHRFHLEADALDDGDERH